MAVPKEKKEAIRALAEAVMAQPPEKHWQLLVLNHIDPNHAVFQKGYVKPKSLRKKVNTFMENIVMKDPTATAVVFEELCKSRSLSFIVAEILIQPASLFPSCQHNKDAQTCPSLEAGQY